MKPLTKRQKEIYNKIKYFIKKNGYAPTLNELATILNTSNLSTAQYFVNTLVAKGVLGKNYYKQSGIYLI